ncbi:hypothetical protein OSB04_006443 [Centaurea solstitialis]|uniref:Uncharacterized protein n=1 Tax=Centaurea solstitialis TaxID=347529 RepID=A0AA38THX6_9ASTR|nr:hypothetical protein OSB04_006443 [Centaurea solstitialis]
MDDDDGGGWDHRFQRDDDGFKVSGFVFLNVGFNGDDVMMMVVVGGTLGFKNDDGSKFGPHMIGDEDLQSTNSNDLVRLLVFGEKCGFTWILESIDCMHWKWKNYPTVWHEVVNSYDLWIWHAFFRLIRSLNDINILKHSFVFSDIIEGRAPLISYKVKATLVKTIPALQKNKQKLFAKE